MENPYLLEVINEVDLINMKRTVVFGGIYSTKMGTTFSLVHAKIMIYKGECLELSMINSKESQLIIKTEDNYKK
jgi:hypothetical protein